VIPPSYLHPAGALLSFISFAIGRSYTIAYLLGRRLSG